MEQSSHGWRKSTYSGDGASCVEAGQLPGWRTSTYSGNNGQSGSCVELGQTVGPVLVRDTKQDGSGPVLEFGADTWARFTRSLKG